jgi:hypothetical protein
MTQCSNCRVWKRNAAVDLNYGQCRKTAPIPIIESIGNGAVWPITLYDDWCGGWEAKQKEPANIINGNIKNIKKYKAYGDR